MLFFFHFADFIDKSVIHFYTRLQVRHCQQITQRAVSQTCRACNSFVFIPLSRMLNGNEVKKAIERHLRERDI